MNIEIKGDQMSVTFDTFNIEAYRFFLKVKKLPEYRVNVDSEGLARTITAPARFAPMLGLETTEIWRPGLPLSRDLQDDQVAIVQTALESKRYACWSDCGLGKTFIQLEWARQVVHLTNGRVLLVTMAEIVPEFLGERDKWYRCADAYPIDVLASRQAMRQWCALPGSGVGITNYEKFNHEGTDDQVVPELRMLAGLDLDESSRLKTGGGKQKWAIIKSARGIEYKLSCTATPAPNEIMEFASQASFLEKMRSENDIIWTYFRRDEKTHRWTVKKHAREAFFEFMSSWSIYVRDPRKYGWRAGVEFPPDPQFITHKIDTTDEQRQFVMDHNAANLDIGEHTASMFADEGNAISVGKLSQAAKGFVYQKPPAQRVRRIPSAKPAIIAGIVQDEARAGRQILVWTEYDAEADILAEAIGDAVPFELLTGKISRPNRAPIIERFRTGQIKCLISRADLLGFGQNFQCCSAMIFSGWSFSFEDFYQACRRAWRFGQTESVRIHLPVIPELEGQMLDAIDRKSRQYEAAVSEMEANYVKARARIRGQERAA